MTTVALILAFAPAVLSNPAVTLLFRAVSYAAYTAATWLLIRSRLFLAGRSMAAAANRLRDKEATVTGAMKAEALRARTMREMEAMRQNGLKRRENQIRMMRDASGRRGSGRGEEVERGSTGQLSKVNGLEQVASLASPRSEYTTSPDLRSPSPFLRNVEVRGGGSDHGNGRAKRWPRHVIVDEVSVELGHWGR